MSSECYEIVTVSSPGRFSRFFVRDLLVCFALFCFLARLLKKIQNAFFTELVARMEHGPRKEPGKCWHGSRQKGGLIDFKPVTFALKSAHDFFSPSNLKKDVK